MHGSSLFLFTSPSFFNPPNHFYVTPIITKNNPILSHRVLKFSLLPIAGSTSSSHQLIALYPSACIMHQANDPESSENSIEMVNYMLSNAPPQTQISLDKLSFADVMQFAEFGPKLTLNQSKVSSDEDSYLLKLHDEPLLLPPPPPPPPRPPAAAAGEDNFRGMVVPEDHGEILKKLESDHKTGGGEVKNRRKRPRSMKTSEEVESQRMTHIAVERNRRRQMNEHLRVLRSLMPGSYVQRGDQASIIGGAIEFVRELEQLLQCLESQKRRRLFGNSGEAPRAILDGPPVAQQPPPAPLYPPSLPFPTSNIEQIKLLDIDPGGGGGGGALREEMAENKSCLADIEVRVVGFDAMIKILSRRRPGQLIKTIAALEDLQFAILHTNITTIEQTVLYSFNVKIACETRWTAEDIANSIQQILSYIDANTV